jgi:hypothetical protein
MVSAEAKMRRQKQVEMQSYGWRAMAARVTGAILCFPSTHQKFAKQLPNNGNKLFSSTQSPRFMDLHPGNFSQQLVAIQNKEIL